MTHIHTDMITLALEACARWKLYTQLFITITLPSTLIRTMHIHTKSSYQKVLYM